MTPEEPTLKKGETVELEIESAAFEGRGVARTGGLVVFVRNAVPGDRARVLIQRKKRKFAEGIAEEIVHPSPDRVDPPCPHFGTCGGCNWQNFDYGRQLEVKRQHVVDLLERIGHLREIEVRPTLAAPAQYHYRNKMEFTFGAGRWLTRQEIDSGEELRKDFALGLHVPRRFDKLLDLETCLLPDPVAAEILAWTRAFALEQDWTAYHWRRHRGFLRNLVIRTSRSGQVLVSLVTSSRDEEGMQAFGEALLEAFPALTTLLNTVNPTRSPVTTGETFLEHGPGVIEEELGGLRFRLGPDTFFQPNTAQAERLFEVVRELARLEGGETVVDLYCGVGAIALFLARHAGRVIGLELQEAAVEEARANARFNGIDNCTFEAGDVARASLPLIPEDSPKPDLYVLDPPRAGLHPKLSQGLVASGPPRIVYVSCNPATQARDLEVLASAYRIDAVQPVDMFPQTYHIENVVSLVRSAQARSGIL